MSTYFISAADVLFFRDGREIKPGSEYTAASLFPPSPATVYGALRSAIISNQVQADFSKDDFALSTSSISTIVGKKTVFGTLNLLNFNFARKSDTGVEQLFKVPNDVLKRKKPPKEQDKQVILTKILKAHLEDLGISSNVPLNEKIKLNWFTSEEGQFYEYEHRFLTEKQFGSYLISNSKDVSPVVKQAIYDKEPLDLFKKEPRIGIGINGETHTVEEGILFTTPFIRLNENIGFHIELDGTHLTENTRLRLGGDGKLAFVESSQSSTELAWEKIRPHLSGKTAFKLVLTTPAIFEKGWIPDGLDENGVGVINDVSVRLIGASIGKYQNIGGWDLAIHQPKSTKRAVPSGSVYYFELLDRSDVNDLENIHGKSICQKEFKQQGFGISYIGVYQ